MSGILIANPGAIPELHQLAAALANSGALAMYVSPFTVTDPDARGAGLPLSVQKRYREELRRRALPVTIGPDRTSEAAQPFELAVCLSQRAGAPAWVTDSLLRLRNDHFDHATEARLAAGYRAFVGSWGASLHSLRKARQLGTVSFLDVPNAHHGYARDLLQEEARIQPAFAGTLQMHRIDPQLERRVNQELHEADWLFVLSSFQGRTYEMAGVPPAKMIVTPLGVDLELFKPNRRPSDRFRVLFVGQVTQRKGISYLLDAFTRANLPDADLVFAGRVVGSRQPWANRPGVRHRDHVPRWLLPELYADADVFVLPSLIEGFAMTALEAMASGLPIIVSEHTFGHEVIDDGENGYVVPIRDPDAIAERLVRLHEDRDLREAMGRKARQRAQDFSWASYAERVLAAITSRW